MALSRASLVAVCAVGAMVVAGCGRGDGETAAAPAGTLADGPATGTITMWAQGAEAERLPALLKGFEAANPGVTVNVTAIPWADAHGKYQTAIAGGATPDLAQMGTTWMPDFASAFDAVPQGIDTSDVLPGAKAPTVVKGSTVGVPWYVDTHVVYYRTDMAAKAGYTSPPDTWADFKAMTKAMQTEAGAKWGINLLNPGGTDTFQAALPFVWSNGASLMNGDGSQWTLDTPQMIEAMKYFQSFFTEGIANPNASTAIGARESAFVDGSTPVLIASPSQIGSLDKAGGPGFSGKYGLMRFPKQRSATSFVGGSDLVVFRNSPNRDAAWKLVRWLTRADVQAEWYKATGDLPAVQAAWNDASLSGDPKLAVFKAQLGDVKSPPANTAWTQVAAAADAELERVVKGTDCATAMKALQSAANLIGTGE
jgi:multiple sugar transport system substrate-binding protein